LSEPESQVGGGIGPMRRPDFLKPTYANFVSVGHTPWDFRFTFALLSPPETVQDEQGETQNVLTPDVVAEVIIPANLMAAVVGAVQTNFTNYMNQFGPPGLNPEGPFTVGGDE
jgi:hypothetical protein